ncbi:MAG TPA: glycosyltransferase family 9 protein [bacterium]|nr:glycosyltransferase family 9 protein [bacterium]HOL34313.1 glycosyltransferase family 9 protein [bacterium]HPP08619.1 glycosyltransferase family 9 protein [bacterium]
MVFRRKFKKEIINRGLIIGLSSIGDNLLITPAIKLMRDALYNAEFDIVVGPRAIEFARDNPMFSHFYVWDKKTGMIMLIKMLRHQKYDLVVDFRNSLIPFFLKSRYRLTFFTKELFSDKFRTHEAERTLRFFTPLFGKYEKVELYFPLTDSEIHSYFEFFKNIGVIDGSRKVVVMNPGAAFEKKRWDKENFIEVGKRIIQNYHINIAIVGNNKEFDLAAEIRRAIDNPEVFNLAGKITFRQLAYLLSCAALLITNDTGTMHLASAMKCPVIAIFGPGNPMRYGPIGNKNIVLHTQRDCFPCVVESKCKKGFICMNDITADDVCVAVSKIFTSD